MSRKSGIGWFTAEVDGFFLAEMMRNANTNQKHINGSNVT
jgi:hypothetical protein